MAYAATLRGVRAATPVRTRVDAAPRWSLLRSVASAIVDTRRRRAMRELRRHRPFGPLVSIRHIGLTRDELMPY